MFKNMRRSDRQINDPKEIAKVIRECEIIRLALKDGDGIYIVPLHFGIGGSDEEPVLYTHSAAEGHKMDLIRQNGYAAFEMDCDVRLMTADIACGYSSSFKSVIGEATVTLEEDPAEKKKALSLIMEHYSGSADWEMPDATVAKTGVLKIQVTDMTCKVHE